MPSATPPIPGLALSVLIAVALASTPSRGVAQPSIASVAQPSRPLALRPSWALAVSDPPSPIVSANGPSSAPGPRAWRAERRLDVGSALIGLGAGIAGGAAFLGARFGRPGYCYYDGDSAYVRGARVAAGVFGGLGVALTVTGAGLMLGVPRADRRSLEPMPIDRLTRAGIVAASVVGGFALGMASVFVTNAGGVVECWSS